MHLRVLKITRACHRIICQQHLSWALQSPRKDHLVERESEHLPRNDRPLPKGGSPEIGGITARFVGWQSVAVFCELGSPFGYPKTITSKDPLGKHSLELTQHMTEKMSQHE